MHKIIDEVGIDRLADVIAAADGDTIAYRGGEPLEKVDPEDDWRRFLDLAQEVAGSEVAPELFRRYVVRSFEVEEMDQRDEARSQLADLEAAAAGWVTPSVIRRPMSEWEFAEALTAMGEAAAVLDMRDRLLAKAATADLEVSDVMQSRYEVVDGTFDHILDYGEVRMAAIDVIEAAQGELSIEPDLMTQVGLWRSDDPGELVVAARNAYNDDYPSRAVALADRAVADLAAARELGVERTRNAVIAAGVLVMLVLALMIWWIVRRRHRQKLRIARQGVYDAISAALIERRDDAVPVAPVDVAALMKPGDHTPVPALERIPPLIDM